MRFYPELFISLVVILIAIPAISQNNIKLRFYKGSNKISYALGDTIKLGNGSEVGGRFIYITSGYNGIPASKKGALVTIKKINKYNYKHFKGVILTVKDGNRTYTLDIENAIASCEIAICISKTMPEEEFPIEKKYFKYTQNNKSITKKELMRILYQDEKAYRKFKTAKIFQTAGWITASTGSILLIFSAAKTTEDLMNTNYIFIHPLFFPFPIPQSSQSVQNPDQAEILAIGGVSMIGASLIFTTIYHIKKGKAVKTYNKRLLTKEPKSQVNLNWGLTVSGIGITLNF